MVLTLSFFFASSLFAYTESSKEKIKEQLDLCYQLYQIRVDDLEFNATFLNEANNLFNIKEDSLKKMSEKETLAIFYSKYGPHFKETSERLNFFKSFPHINDYATKLILSYEKAKYEMEKSLNGKKLNKEAAEIAMQSIENIQQVWRDFGWFYSEACSMAREMGIDTWNYSFQRLLALMYSNITNEDNSN